MPDITQPTFADGAILTASSVNDTLFNTAVASYGKMNGLLSLANLDPAFKVEASMVRRGTLVRTAKVSASSYLEMEALTARRVIPGAAMLLEIPSGAWSITVSWAVVVDTLLADWPDTKFYLSLAEDGTTERVGTSYRGEGLYEGTIAMSVSGSSPSIQPLGIWVVSNDGVQVGSRRMCVTMIRSGF